METRIGGGDSCVRLGPLMAMTFVSNVPLLAACFAALRHIIQAIVFTGNKGQVVAAFTSTRPGS